MQDLVLQEVTSKKDQRQFWKGKKRAYRYVTVSEMAAFFKDSHLGQKTAESLSRPPEKADKGVSKSGEVIARTSASTVLNHIPRSASKKNSISAYLEHLLEAHHYCHMCWRLCAFGIYM